MYRELWTYHPASLTPHMHSGVLNTWNHARDCNHAPTGPNPEFQPPCRSQILFMQVNPHCQGVVVLFATLMIFAARVADKERASGNWRFAAIQSGSKSHAANSDVHWVIHWHHVSWDTCGNRIVWWDKRKHYAMCCIGKETGGGGSGLCSRLMLINV